MKYKAREPEVEAILFTRNTFDEVVKFIKEHCEMYKDVKLGLVTERCPNGKCELTAFLPNNIDVVLANEYDYLMVDSQGQLHNHNAAWFERQFIVDTPANSASVELVKFGRNREKSIYYLTHSLYFDEDGDLCDTKEEAEERGNSYSCLRRQKCYLLSYDELSDNLKPQADDYLDLYVQNGEHDRQYFIENYVFMVEFRRRKVLWMVDKWHTYIGMKKLIASNGDIKYVDLFECIER